MNKAVCILTNILFCGILCAQTQKQTESVNQVLDNTPYFERMQVDYNAGYILPDSTKAKIIKALNRELPQHFADSVFTLQEAVLENITKSAWQECKTDTVCFKREYQRMYEEDIALRKKVYSSKCYSRNLILACGSWNIKEAIPYLNKELSNKNCSNYEQRKKSIEMALAKLGNDSVMKYLKESGTISHLVTHTELDTVNNEKVYYNSDIFYSSAFNYSQLALYFRGKSFYYDMIDLLYIRGYLPAMDLELEHTEILLLMSWDMHEQWKNYPNYNQWKELINKYLEFLFDTAQDKNEWEKTISRAFKQQMITELKKWIENNIAFE